MEMTHECIDQLRWRLHLKKLKSVSVDAWNAGFRPITEYGRLLLGGVAYPDYHAFSEHA
jgi:hypothetical protein